MSAFRIYKFFRGQRRFRLVGTEATITAAKAAGHAKASPGSRKTWFESVGAQDGARYHEWMLKDDAIIVVEVGDGFADRIGHREKTKGEYRVYRADLRWGSIGAATSLEAAKKIARAASPGSRDLWSLVHEKPAGEKTWRDRWYMADDSIFIERTVG